MPILEVLKLIVDASAAGFTAYSGVKGLQETEEINTEGLAFAEKSRRDILNQNRINNELNEKQLSFTKEEAELNRKERAEQTGYNRLQNAANRYGEYLNNKNALTKSRLSPLMGGRQ